MALALVRLQKKDKNGRVKYFLDYISYEAAKLGVLVQGEEHAADEWSKPEILRIFEPAKNMEK